MIWAVLFLGVTCSVLCGTVVFLERQHSRERARLINLALAKDPATFTTLQIASRHEPAPAQPRKAPDPDRVKQPALPEGL